MQQPNKKWKMEVEEYKREWSKADMVPPFTNNLRHFNTF